MARGKKLSKENETVEQRLAFEEYLRMGDNRSLAKIADVLGKQELTISRWSKALDWVERARAADMANIDTAGVESLTESMDKRKNNLKLIDSMLRDSAIIDEEGNVVGSTIKLRSMNDIRTALEVREALLGTAKTSNGKGGNIGNIEKAVFIIKKG